MALDRQGLKRQAALATPADPGDDDQFVQRDFEREVLEVVDPDPLKHDRVPTGGEVHPEEDTG